MKTGRRIILGMLGVLLGVVVASWVRSYFALDMVSYRYGTLRAPGEDRDDPTMWTYVDRRMSADHRRGAIEFVSSRYKSLGRSREDMRGWLEAKSWARASVPMSEVRSSDPRPLFQLVSVTDWNVLGLGVARVSKQGTDSLMVGVPHWMVGMVLAGLLASVARGSKAERRRRRGWCPKCGYDIKGAFGEGCPECGWGRAKVAALTL